MKQLIWIATVVAVSFYSAQITMANFQDLGSNSTEFVAAPILFRSAFIGRTPLASRQENVAVPVIEEPINKSHLIDKAEEPVEKNPAEKTNDSNEEIDSSENRYKKNVSDESGSDESDSNESDSDESGSEENEGEEEDGRPRRPSRWRPTRFGSSFRLQAVRRPINYRHPH